MWLNESGGSYLEGRRNRESWEPMYGWITAPPTSLLETQEGPLPASGLWAGRTLSGCPEAGGGIRASERARGETCAWWNVSDPGKRRLLSVSVTRISSESHTQMGEHERWAEQ